MAKKILLTDSGVYREAKEAFVTVNGVYRKVKEGFVTVNGVYRQFYSGGLQLADLPVGALVSLNVNSVPENFIVAHHGLPLDDGTYDASCDGVWMLAQYCLDQTAASTGSTYLPTRYYSSLFNDYIEETYFPLIDEKVQSIIKTVKVPYQYYADSEYQIAEGADGYETKCFPLSAPETGLTVSTDGGKLDYFTTANASRIATTKSGTAVIWWLRSIYSTLGRVMGAINTTGARTGASRGDTEYNVRPAFILPNDAIVNSTPNADGSYTLLV